MHPLEAAILRTVLYADVFDFPMQTKEIHHFLIHDTVVSLADVTEMIASSPVLKLKLEQVDQYIVYRGRDHIIQTRHQRESASRHLLPLAEYWGRWLAALPFVRMVALTGALAVRNAAHDDDDLDYVLVTAPHRVWLARAFAILVVRIGRLRGVKICPNYVLSESALAQSRRDVFLAHEVAQMVPLYGMTHYNLFREANDWVYQQLPNATDPFFVGAQISLRTASYLKTALEMVCGGIVGNWLEQWEYKRKLKRFAQDIQTPNSAAQLDTTQVKGHFNDHGHPVLRKYDQRLAECGLTEERLARTGD